MLTITGKEDETDQRSERRKADNTMNTFLDTDFSQHN